MDLLTLALLDAVSSRLMYFSKMYIAYTEEEIITAGSHQLLNLVMKYRANLTVNLHGHCHTGRGMC